MLTKQDQVRLTELQQRALAAPGRRVADITSRNFLGLAGGWVVGLTANR